MKAVFGYIYIAMTILLTVYGQLIIKWQVNVAGTPPEATGEKALFLLRLLFMPWVLSGLAAAFLAAVFWLATLTRFLHEGWALLAVAYLIGLFFHERRERARGAIIQP